jgi:hypothetical protein
VTPTREKDMLRGMTRRVTVHLDEFGHRSLERLVERGKGSPATAFRTAALYYLAHRDAGRQAWRAPRFRTRPAAKPGLRVAFDDETWEALEDEASRQGIKTEELAVHALMYFLADFERGEVSDVLRHLLDE